MKKYILLCLLALIASIGCNKNDDIQSDIKPNLSQEIELEAENNTTTPIFEAGFENENDQTRTFIDESINVLWNADDEISIFYHDSFNRRYSFDGNTGDDRGSFSHSATTEAYNGSELTTNYAVYPYSKDTSIAGDGTISITLPAVQKYVPKSFGVGANAMVAITKDKDDLYLPFKNLCGYLKLKLYGDVTVKSIKLQGENKEPIAGPATITAEYGKAPSLTMGEKASSTITLDCGDGVTLGTTEESATEFWIVVPPTIFENGFNISVVEIDSGECFSMTTKTRSIERNSVLSMKAKASYVAEYTTPTSNTIWYTTTDGKAINNPTADFGSPIISNTYKNGRGAITFAEDITTIPNSAFEYESLTRVIMPNSITSIGSDAFYGCSSLTNITIPGRVTEIGSYAFSGCSSITSITIPSSVTEIGSYAFENCGGELTVNCNIPDASSSRGDYGKFYNSKFTKVTIGEGITKIGSYAFYGCSSITNINIPSSVTEIGEYAFYGCSSLACDITIPSGITKINDCTFYDCSNLTSITIPSSVTEISSYAFGGCGGELMVNCNIPDPNSSYSSDHGKFYNSKFTKVTISNGVTKLGSYAFFGCGSIISISIPSSVTEIGSYAFGYCSRITSISIGEGVTKIGSEAFIGCSSITSLNIPGSVTEIGGGGIRRL